MAAATKYTYIYPAIFLAAGLCVLIINFSLIAPILLSLSLILLVTLALNPLVARLRKFLWRRDVATLAITVGFLALLALLIWAFYTPVQRVARDLTHRVPQYWQQIQAPLQKLDGAAPKTPGATPEVEAHPATTAILTHVGKWLQSFVSNTAAMAGVAITVFVGVIYTLINPRPVFATFLGLVPEEHQETAARIGRRMVVFVPRWAAALGLGMLIVGVLVFIAVWPILGFQDAVLMGVIAFAFEAIPYVGAIFAGAPALLIAAQQGGSTPMWIVIAYVSIQLLDHNVIQPWVVAGSVEQHPLAVIAAVLFCLPMFGILGVLLATPLVALLEILYEEVYHPRYLPTTSLEELNERTREILGSGSKQSRTATMSEKAEEEARSKRLHGPHVQLL
jgi:predicted PurR-regulated permease PerM